MDNIPLTVFNQATHTQSLNVQIRAGLRGDRVYITDPSRSYLILDQTSVNISLGKINHLFLRNCHNCSVSIENTISGIDVLFCSGVKIIVKNIPFIELWASSVVTLIFNTYSKIILSHCYEIFFNGIKARAIPFERVFFPEENGDNTTIPSLTILN